MPTIFDNLNWTAPSISTVLYVELPFWIMVPDCSLDVDVNGHTFQVDIRDNYIEQYIRVIGDSRLNCFYMGLPKQPKKENKIIHWFRKRFTTETPSMERKCKTILGIHSNCNKDVLSTSIKGKGYKDSSYYYLRSFCAAHITVINNIIQHYRISTYDYFPYEVSPWDVPIWFIVSEIGSTKINLFDYAGWDEKPILHLIDSSTERYKLIDIPELQSSMALEPSAGEYELLDSLNFMERGDYSGAIRRITTAIEAQTESVLRQELLKKYSAPDVENKLEASQNDFPGRLHQYEKLSGRSLQNTLSKELDRTRHLRHAIVHNAKRIQFNEHGEAQRSVDTGRWIFNWLENNPARMAIREQQLGKRSLGRAFFLLNVEINSSGVIVHKPLNTT